jgi:RNase P/RNase MRP subunit p30
MQDIVIPNKNENKFIEIADKLGYDELIFLYKLKDFKKKEFKSNIKIKQGILVYDKEIKKAQHKSNIVIVKTINSRGIVESNKNITLKSLETDKSKDFMHQRRSNFNQVIAKLATKNKIKIAFSFNDLLNATEPKRSIILGRLKENIKLVRKYKNQAIIASFATTPYEMRSRLDLKSFFSNLGLNSSQIIKL